MGKAKKIGLLAIILAVGVGSYEKRDEIQAGLDWLKYHKHKA